VYETVNKALEIKHDEVIETIEDKTNGLIPEMLRVSELNRDITMKSINTIIADQNWKDQRIRDLELQNQKLKELLKDTYGHYIMEDEVKKKNPVDNTLDQ